MLNSKKIIDTSANASVGSRADNYWREMGFEDFTMAVRPNLPLPKSLNLDKSSIELVQRRFSIKDLSFGNWVSIEDRHNYLNSLILCCYDLNKVIAMNQNIGFGRLSVAFGARGKGRALAHYEPHFEVINITRYRQDTEFSKLSRFIGSGGMGAFAHEYGHFLDYYAGQFLDKSTSYFAVTGGRITSKNRTNAGGEIRETVDDILESIIWKTPNKKISPYYLRLTDIVEENEGMGEYFLRRNEIFARWFEAWISYELRKQGINNRLLAQPKYDKRIYPINSELETISPLFKRFCSLVKAKVII